MIIIHFGKFNHFLNKAIGTTQMNFIKALLFFLVLVGQLRRGPQQTSRGQSFGYSWFKFQFKSTPDFNIHNRYNLIGSKRPTPGRSPIAQRGQTHYSNIAIPGINLPD